MPTHLLQVRRQFAVVSIYRRYISKIYIRYIYLPYLQLVDMLGVPQTTLRRYLKAAEALHQRGIGV